MIPRRAAGRGRLGFHGVSRWPVGESIRGFSSARSMSSYLARDGLLGASSGPPRQRSARAKVEAVALLVGFGHGGERPPVAG